MNLPGVARIPVFVLLMLMLMLLASGCSTAPAVTSAPTATPTVSNAPTPSSAPTATPQQSSPPDAALGSGDVADIGWLGSYCWQGKCADVFDIPAKETLPRATVGTNSLVFSLVDGEFSQWNARYGSNGNTLSPLARGGENVDPDASGASPGPTLSYVEFANPPSGDWLVLVQVFFPGGGDASYGWHVTVP